MTNLEFFLDNNYNEFIADFEDKWLQFEDIDKKMESYFGNIENAKKLFEKWKNGEDIWYEKRNLTLAK